LIDNIKKVYEDELLRSTGKQDKLRNWNIKIYHQELDFFEQKIKETSSEEFRQTKVQLYNKMLADGLINEVQCRKRINNIEKLSKLWHVR